MSEAYIPTITNLDDVEKSGFYLYKPEPNTLPQTTDYLINLITPLDLSRFKQEQALFDNKPAAFARHRKRIWEADGTKSEWEDIPIPQKIFHDPDAFTLKQEEQIRKIVREEILRVPSEPSGEKSELIVRRLIDYLYKLAGASVSSDTDIRMRDGLSALALLSHESPKEQA